jgi:hypothetical protein
MPFDDFFDDIIVAHPEPNKPSSNHHLYFPNIRMQATWGLAFITSLCGVLSLVLTFLFTFTIIIPALADIAYILFLVIMVIVNVIVFFYYLGKRKKDIIKKKCFIMSIISVILVLGNIACIAIYIITMYAISHFNSLL